MNEPGVAGKTGVEERPPLLKLWSKPNAATGVPLLLRPNLTQFGRWPLRHGLSREESNLHQDFKDLLQAFADEGVSYLLIGGYAVTFHDRPRYTKDLDLWIDSSSQNRERVYRALSNFGAPVNVLEDLRTLAPGEVLWMGNPPVRVDILQQVYVLDYSNSYARRVRVAWHGVPVNVLSREDLIVSKKAAGRLKIWSMPKTCSNPRRMISDGCWLILETERPGPGGSPVQKRALLSSVN